MGDIDKPSFVLGELTGTLKAVAEAQIAIQNDINDIKKSVSHIKVKNASQAATIAVVLSLVVAFFKDLFKGAS